MTTITSSPPCVNIISTTAGMMRTYGIVQRAGQCAALVAGPLRWSAAEANYIPTMAEQVIDRTTAVALANHALRAGLVTMAERDTSAHTARIEWTTLVVLAEVPQC